MIPTLILVSFVAAIVGQASPSPEPEPAPPDTITIGRPVRALPFPLNLDRRAPVPRSLQEMVDRIYQALPQERLDMFAAYHGSNDLDRMTRRYDSTIDFFRDLHTIEILYEADRVWGFDDGHFPLGPAILCVGDDFVDQVAIQIAMRRLREVGSEGVPAPPRDMAGAYTMGDRISRQLFALCDRLHSPSRSDRQGQ